MLRIDHQILDLRGATDTLSIQWSPRAGPPSGSISFADWTVNFDELTGVYFRNVPLDDPSDEIGDPIDHVYPRIDPEIAAVLNSLRCRVVNRPAATYSNRSKPYQTLIIRQIGLGIPKTLITNDPRAARQFYYECEGKVVRKSLSGVRSIVRRMNEKDLDGLAVLEQGPAQFQEYLPGDNIRVHVVGERSFAVRIQCDAVDYRYAGQEGYARRMIPAKLPADLETNCVRLAKEFGLAMAGIDLKETPGEYFCFEVNTSPAFPFYESVARPIIADALAEFLAGSDGEK